MKIASVVGARPQFVKAAAVSRELREAHQEILIHTGQHYDARMSQVFFDELHIPAPDLNLEVGSGSHGAQTAAMLIGLEEAFELEAPDRVLVYGDTNSTLAGALAAAKLDIPVAHVEAGLRSFNRGMPEEVNRVVADHLSDQLFCPSSVAVANLEMEGITDGVHLVGDVMADVLAWALEEIGDSGSETLDELGLRPGDYLLATVHRAENTGDPARLDGIVAALAGVGEPVVLPLHPRTRKVLARHAAGVDPFAGTSVRCVEPVAYLEMMRLVRGARGILTDSGGLQKEAYWLKRPCITLRDETEWVETVDTGWNVLAGADTAEILGWVERMSPPADHPSLYGDGTASSKILHVLSTQTPSS